MPLFALLLIACTAAPSLRGFSAWPLVFPPLSLSRDSLDVLHREPLPTEVELGESGLPSLVHPSDHLPLVCDLGFLRPLPGIGVGAAGAGAGVPAFAGASGAAGKGHPGALSILYLGRAGSPEVAVLTALAASLGGALSVVETAVAVTSHVHIHGAPHVLVAKLGTTSADLSA